jgi:predicted RNase H-like HicB family nuclease
LLKLIRRQTPVSCVYMADLVFEAVQDADGGYCAECLTENIFTQGDTWDELRRNVIEATAALFFDEPPPERIRLHLVRDEVLSVA